MKRIIFLIFGLCFIFIFDTYSQEVLPVNQESKSTKSGINDKILTEIERNELQKFNNSGDNIIQELILGVPKVTEKNLYLLTDIIDRTKGVTYTKYCPKHRLVLLKYNATIYAQKEDVVRAIKSQKFPLTVLLKKGTYNDAFALEMCD